MSYDVIGMTAFDSERPSILIPPNDAPHRPDFSEPPDSNAMPLSCRWVLRLGVHELVLAAPFATHSAPDQLSLDITEDFPEVSRQIPMLDVAQPATD
ncbi:hypothetical protein [Mesorhizobium loti]|uniref:hypothetical protein n=1 Tax=Rhizobium loti TaxID=381 RepID=UPI001377BD9D|nr:hypothetical protein [Mesorhizobium loti]